MKPDGVYATINTVVALETLCSQIMDQGIFCIDVETTSVDQMTCELVGISLSALPGEGYYIPLAHKDGTVQLSVSDVQPYVAMLCSDTALTKVFFNALYDMVVLERYGMPVVPDLVYDVMVTEFTLDNGKYYRFNMAVIAERILGIEMTPISDLIGRGKNEVTFDYVPVALATDYAAADVDIPLRLYWQRKVMDVRLARKNEQVDFPLISVLKRITMNGILVDLPYVHEMKNSMENDIISKQAIFEEIIGCKASVFGYAALSGILFDNHLGLQPAPGYDRSKAGNFSTAGTHLELIRDQHPVIDVIIALREMNYVMQHHIVHLATRTIRSRIHTGYNHTNMTTRLSTVAPNLQNVIIRTVGGYDVRKAFIVAEGSKWVKADYSQVELRVLAHLLVTVFKDWRYAEVFLNGGDVHRDTAAAIMNIHPDQVTSDQRGIAKAINFGIIYGMSKGGLMHALKTTYAVASRFYESYLDSYPGIEGWMKWQSEIGDRQGYIESPIFGMRRHVLKGSYTICLNTPIQSGAAEIIRKAMIDIQTGFDRRGMRSNILLQIHDELDFEVPDIELAEALPLISDSMSGAVPLAVPLVVDLELGDNWSAIEPVVKGVVKGVADDG